MKHLKIFTISVFSLLFVIACSKNEDHSHHDNSDVDKNHNSELVREGTIDIESIDLNKDGKIHECPMDWNVLSDTHGNCPTCGMNLKEYSIDEVKANLDKYGYDYKK